MNSNLDYIKIIKIKQIYNWMVVLKEIMIVLIWKQVD